MLKSPGIEIFENAVEPVSTVTYGNGIATIGFSTNGPIGKLMKFNSMSDFEKTMGNPVKDYPFAHVLVNKCFSGAANASVYFIRIGTFDDNDNEAGKSSVYVTNHSKIDTAKLFLQAKYSVDGSSVSDVKIPYLFLKSKPTTDEETKDVVLSLVVNGETVEKTFVFSKQTVKPENTTPDTYYVIPIDKVISELNKESKISSNLTLASSLKDKVGNIEYGLFITSKSYQAPASGANIGLTSFASTDGNEVSLATIVDGSDYELDFGEAVGSTGTKAKSPVDGDYVFKFVSKYPGSGTVDIKIKKSVYVNPITSAETMNIDVYTSSSDYTPAEQFTGLTIDNFIEKINDDLYGSQFVNIEVVKDTVDENTPALPVFSDGTYVLGKGELLADGTYYPANGDYVAVKGTDGVPSGSDALAVKNAIDELYVSALKNPDLANLDNVSFSILATPNCGSEVVQNAAIELVDKRGDAVYLVDAPQEYCEMKKTGILQTVNWSNGASGLRGTPIESSQAIVYYGWLSTGNPYGSGNLSCPPSVFIAPKMLTIDNTDGAFYAPAGAIRGRIIASDYTYSPDLDDRELMVGDLNCVNPIIYSSARGLMVYAQKTALRTTSPLNRVNIRRLTNEIKRKLYVALDEIKFEINNSDTQERARRLTNEVFSSYKNLGAIQTFTTTVSAPGGADRDVLNIYCDFVPYGLVERIRIFLTISDAASTTVGEATE